MFQEDLLDEEVKKKKRRILVLLFVLLLLGMMTALPLVELSPVTSQPTLQAVGEAPAHTATATRSALGATGTFTDVPTVVAISETTVPLDATPSATATRTLVQATPTVTAETPGGAGGGVPEDALTATAVAGSVTLIPTQETPGAVGAGTPEASLTVTAVADLLTPAVTETPGVPLTVTGVPTGTALVQVSPTPTDLGALPAAGASASQRMVGLVLGSAVALLASLMLLAGYALRRARLSQR